MNLDSDFEDDLQKAVLDDVEQRAREEIAPEFEERVVELLEDYGQRHDYDVSTIVAGLTVSVERDTRSVRIVAEFPDPALLFERGTVDHEIRAQNADVLSFVWEESPGGHAEPPPQWVREEFDREGAGWRVFLPKVEVSGLPEGRFIRDALNELRSRLQT